MGERRDGQWIDISVPLYSGMVHWPGDTEVSIERSEEMAAGAICNLTRLKMSAHTGTHVDAPLHFLPDGASIDTAPLAALIGPARVVEIEDQEQISADELARHEIQAGERLLLKTRNSPAAWQSDHFVEDYVYVSADAARYLVERGISTVGVDYLSVSGYRSDASEVHRILLKAGIWIVEGLNLANVQSGQYQLICLPLKLRGADGAPARAVLREAQGDKQ